MRSGSASRRLSRISKVPASGAGAAADARRPRGRARNATAGVANADGARVVGATARAARAVAQRVDVARVVGPSASGALLVAEVASAPSFQPRGQSSLTLSIRQSLRARRSPFARHGLLARRGLPAKINGSRGNPRDAATAAARVGDHRPRKPERLDQRQLRGHLGPGARSGLLRRRRAHAHRAIPSRQKLL